MARRPRRDAVTSPDRGHSGRLRTRRARRWVGARDTAVAHVLGPGRPGPVPPLVPAGRVDQPARRDPRERDPSWRCARSVIPLTSKRRIGEGARGRRAPAPTGTASLRREGAQREHAEEDHQGDPGLMTVERAASVAPPGETRNGGRRVLSLRMVASDLASRGRSVVPTVLVCHPPFASAPPDLCARRRSLPPVA